MENSFIDTISRLECDGNEFNSNDIVQVFIENGWRKTRIEHSNNKGGYYSIDNYVLLGNKIRIAKP